ncbi:TM2 domain-containing protein [Clostridium tunisiense]|uniref:TM2 domain-containing protein n=1 Tax=Clostridium tunisiense TaxID=219748 RepID=UPI0002D3BB80|nr:TM2 domain-containing protein [Clostridium tunisiense]
MLCTKCNFINDSGALTCSNCGHNLLEEDGLNEFNSKGQEVKKEENDTIDSSEKEDVSNKKWSVVLILCILLGLIGFHRFYVGKGGTAILMLLTLGGFGIWTLVDLVIISLSEFTDEDGRKIKRSKSSIEEAA